MKGLEFQAEVPKALGFTEGSGRREQESDEGSSSDDLSDGGAYVQLWESEAGLSGRRRSYGIWCLSLCCLVKGKGDRGANRDSEITGLETGRMVVPLTETEDKETCLGLGERRI